MSSDSPFRRRAEEREKSISPFERRAKEREKKEEEGNIYQNMYKRGKEMADKGYFEVGRERREKNKEEGHEFGQASFVAQYPKEAAAGIPISVLKFLEHAFRSQAAPGVSAAALQEAGLQGDTTGVSNKLEEDVGIADLPDWAKDEAEITNFLGQMGLNELAKVPGIMLKGRKPPSASAPPPSGGGTRPPPVPPSPPKGPNPFVELRDTLLGRGEKETLPSGMTKHLAIEGPRPELGIITPTRQQKVFEGLDREAADLTKKSIEKHLPLAKEIEEGFDFHHDFEKNFGELKGVAEKFNPDIETGPLNKFLRKSIEPYKGIPEPHSEARSIIKNARAFRKNPPTDLKSLLRIYRSNNKKIKNIYETSRLKGTRKEYVDYLLDQNRAIQESIVKTLPEDSAWAKSFVENNKKYHEYLKTKDTLNILEPVLREDLDTKSLIKLSLDKKKQMKLKLKMGEEGANEVIQIGKDLKLSKDSINKMKISELSKYDAVFPITLLIPGAGKALGATRAVSYGRRAYGYWMSQPQTVKSLDKALKALINHDLPAYTSATQNLTPP